MNFRKLLTYLTVGTAAVIPFAGAQNPTILQGSYISNVFGNSNFVLNPNAQTNVANVTNATRSTTTPLVATSEFTLNLTSGTFATWTLRAFDSGMKGQNCEARFSYRGFATATTTAEIVQNSLVVAQLVLTPSTDPRIASINFPCGDLANATTFRIAQTTANMTGTNEIGAIYTGLATNQANVAQAEEAGKYTMTGAASCNWSTGSTSFTNYSADADCNTATVTGAATTSAGKIPGATFSNLKPGKYMFTVVFYGVKSGSVADSILFRLGDGTTYSTFVAPFVSTITGQVYMPVSLTFTTEYTTVSSPTIQVQANTSSASNTAEIPNTGASQKFELIAYRFPTSSELVVTPERQNWYVNAYHGGANPSLGTSTIATKTEITNGSLTLTPYAASQPAATLCSSTNAPPSLSTSATTCAAGNESLGLTFNIPSVGTYQVCSEFTSNVAANANGTADAYFSLEETGTASTTTTTTNKTVGRNATITSSIANISSPFRICDDFVFSSVGQKAVRLFYTQDITATVTSNLILGDNSNSRSIKWTVKPVTNQSNSALYVQGPVLGAQTGAAIAAGYVGQVLQSKAGITNISSSAYTNLNTVTLTNGVWLCSTQSRIMRNGATVPSSNEMVSCIGNSASANCNVDYSYQTIGTGLQDGMSLTYNYKLIGSKPTVVRYDGTNFTFADGTVSASATGTLAHKVYADATSGQLQAYGFLECVRLN
jgi:hypothetical protein